MQNVRTFFPNYGACADLSVESLLLSSNRTKPARRSRTCFELIKTCIGAKTLSSGSLTEILTWPMIYLSGK